LLQISPHQFQDNFGMFEIEDIDRNAD